LAPIGRRFECDGIHNYLSACFNATYAGEQASARTQANTVAKDQGHRLPARSTITRTTMPARIVTSTFRYKRPPRKRKALPLEGPAVVTKRRALPSVGKHKPELDVPPPANDDQKSAIVTVKRVRRRTRHDAGGAPAARRCRRHAVPRDRAPRQAVTNFRSGTGDPTATTRCPPPPKRWASRSPRFPSWFLRITCERCGKDRMVNESHASWRGRAVRDILKRMRHDGCGELPGRAELLTDIEGASSQPVRRIVLIDG
jgi:hypothetical protein